MKYLSMKIVWIIVSIIVIGALAWFGISRISSPNTNKTNSTNTNTVGNTGLAANRNATNQNTNSSNTNAAVTANTNSNPTNTNANTSQNTNATTTKFVAITRTGFDPQTVTVALGGTVTWANNDSSQHYVAPNNHPTHVLYAGIWDDNGTGNIGPGQTYSQTFSVAGTYHYHDHTNPSTTGTVIVQ